jgi:hypothetical protein
VERSGESPLDVARLEREIGIAANPIVQQRVNSTMVAREQNGNRTGTGREQSNGGADQALAHLALHALKELNPHHTIKFWNGIRSREFLRQHAAVAILNAFDSLRPHTFQSDLMRYALLRGGVVVCSGDSFVNDASCHSHVRKAFFIVLLHV